MMAATPLPKGAECHYLMRAGGWVKVTVKHVHTEEVPPFYTIDMGENRDERHARGRNEVRRVEQRENVPCCLRSTKK